MQEAGRPGVAPCKVADRSAGLVQGCRRAPNHRIRSLYQVIGRYEESMRHRKWLRIIKKSIKIVDANALSRY
jgi:hypothetical protein